VTESRVSLNNLFANQKLTNAKKVPAVTHSKGTDLLYKIFID